MRVSAAYLDTSAFLRLFVDEGGQDETWKTVKKIPALYASRLVFTEACVTLARIHRGGRLSFEDYREALQSVQNFWETDITPVPLNESIHQSAENLAQTHQLRSADALHLGTAIEIRRSLPKGLSIGFVAYDHDLLKAAATLRFIPLPALPL